MGYFTFASRGTFPRTPLPWSRPDNPLATPMNAFLHLLSQPQPLAAIGYSLIYMILGGGIFGAIVIFIVAKIFRK
jgi:hypothetical protein